MKRFVLLFLAAVMLLTLLAPAAYAAEDEETEATEAVEETEEPEETEEGRKPHVSTATSGACGDNLAWNLDGSTLTISGSGEMAPGAPWAHLQDKVKKLVLTGGITTVAEGAFRDFDALRVIEFGGSLKEIGAEAFLGCDELTYISLPASFVRFGPRSFQECTSLTEVYCAGNMPSFRGNCLWTGNYVTVYHPVDKPWPQEAVEQLVSNFGGRLEILAGSGEGYFTYELPEETAAPTEVLTEPETEPTTIPTTEPATEPPTEAPTEAPTQPVTEATEAPEEFTGPDWREEMEQEPEQVQEKALGSRSWIGLALIVGVLTFLVIGALVVRGMSRKEGRYTE